MSRSQSGSKVSLTAGVGQRRRFSVTFFNIFLEGIIADALKGHEGKVSIGGKLLVLSGLPMTSMLLLKNIRYLKPYLKVSTNLHNVLN